MDQYYYAEIEFSEMRPLAFNQDYIKAVELYGKIKKLDKKKNLAPADQDRLKNYKWSFILHINAAKASIVQMA